MQKQKGFTIIELIVVIAIIAVLATIVMINVTGYIGKSKDAAIKGNMQTIASTAAGVYDTYKTYNDTNESLFANVSVNNAMIQIRALSSDSNTVSSHNNATSWCACANLVTNPSYTYCADGTGYKGESTNNGCTVRCNATSQICTN